MSDILGARRSLGRDGSSLRLAALGGLDSGLLLGEDDLDVARRAHVRVDATVSTVCAAALLLRTVDLDVRDEELVHVERLELSVGLSVEQEVEHELGRLLGPPSLAVGGPGVLGLRSA